MVTVQVKSENGKYYVELFNDRLGYRYIGEEFIPGQTPEGYASAEAQANADAADWRNKLTKAGVKVE